MRLLGWLSNTVITTLLKPYSALHTLFIAVVVQTTKKKCIRLKKTLEYSHWSKISLLQVPHTELYQQEIQACISRHKNVVLLYEATWVQFCSDKNHFFRDTKILHRWRLCYIFKRLPFFLLWLWTSPGTTCSNLKKVVTCQVLRTNTCARLLFVNTFGFLSKHFLTNLLPRLWL